MIKVGLTNWAKHPDLFDKKNITLADYASVYSCVEVDSFFYGIKEPSVAAKWNDTVDADFDFIIKASKEITKQTEATEEVIQQECAKLLTALAPLKTKLAGVLLQFPGFFEVSKSNLEYLLRLFEYLQDLPLIVEFRNKSWYSAEYQARTMNFMKEQHVTLAMVDEPQVTNSSIPLDLTITNPDLAFLRFHGRNTNGWRAAQGFESGARTNYDYSLDELVELATQVQAVSEKVKQTIVIFNNNGGLHANKNAMEFQKILGLDFKNNLSEQIELL